MLAILMVVMVGGHLTGVAFGSCLHKENLPLSMIAGRKEAPDGALASRPCHAAAAVMALVVAAFKINRSIPPGVTPLRITETPYWVEKHSGIRGADWQLPLVKSKSHCPAWHMDAVAGTFEDAAMRIPRQGQVQRAASASPRTGK